MHVCGCDVVCTVWKWLYLQTYWGYNFIHNQVLRDNRHKNGDTSYDVCDHYQPYMSGVGYIITYDVAMWIVTAFPQHQFLSTADAAATSPLPPRLQPLLSAPASTEQQQQSQSQSQHQSKRPGQTRSATAKGVRRAVDPVARTLPFAPLQPRFFVNDDVNMGLLMVPLNLVWRDDHNFNPLVQLPDAHALIRQHAEERTAFNKHRIEMLANVDAEHPVAPMTLLTPALRTYLTALYVVLDGLPPPLHPPPMDEQAPDAPLPACAEFQTPRNEQYFCSGAGRTDLVAHVHWEDQFDAVSERYMHGCRCRA